MIDSKLQAELRARFNPDGSDLRKMQLRMLDMLKYIDKICRENNIKYWLSSGTCLGAVRHGGFIPWDDDVDIEMLKKDYMKLKKIFNSTDYPKYEWQDSITDNNFKHPYAKLRDRKSKIQENNQCDVNYKYRGIFIDIFCVTPSNSRILRKIGTSIYLRIINCQVLELLFSKSTLRHFLWKIYIPFVEIIQKFFYNGKYRHITGISFFKERLSCDIHKTIYIPFEDTELPIPIGYDSYLKLLYGDYLKIPKTDQITTHLTDVEFYDVNY